MRHWWQLATRNWRARPVRTLGAALAIALGSGSVVWVTSAYESVRQSVLRWAADYVGRSHITIESPLGKYDHIPQRLVDAVAGLNSVRLAVPRLVQRLRARPLPRAALNDQTRAWSPDVPEMDLIGLALPQDLEIRDYRILAGRMLDADDRDACVLEASAAEEAGVGVGDVLLVWGGSRDEPYEFEIVGLFDRRRIARLQKGMALLPLATLQPVHFKEGLITSIDVVLRDGSPQAVRAAVGAVRGVVQRVVPNASVRSVEARMQQIELAQQQQEFVLLLLSCVALLTALFIILSTLSMGMIERIGQLGLLRCIGLTRGQLAALVLVEIMPLGLAGVLAGIPLGLGLSALTARLVPEYVGRLTVSLSGIGLACGAGLLTTLLAAILPMAAALGVTPLEAARPRARRRSLLLPALVGLIALTALVLQHRALIAHLPRTPAFVHLAAAAVVLLYAGYAMLAPLAVWLFGSGAVHLVARVTRVGFRLLQDQVGHAVWRSAGICCGLMVGLSLLVGLIVFNESFQSGWQFPRQFPEAYVWSFEQLPLPAARAAQIVEQTPGVARCTAANSINVFVEEKPAFMANIWASVTWFLGCDPDSFLDMVRVEFLEGDPQTARALLRQGGHVLVADDFARSRDKHLGDSVRIIFGSRQHVFRIAGVVQSPALDIAAGYFQAQSELNVAASGSVMGTNDDLERLFDVHGTRLVLLNFEPPPPAAPPEDETAASQRLQTYFDREKLTPQQRQRRLREDRILNEVKQRLGAPQAYCGTASELKDEIDRELTRITGLLAAVPAVALVVAAVGVANLMTANVTSRARQIAILRAVGATRGLVLRMVISEALVLGLLGSALGLLLGTHLALDTSTMVERMWGFRIGLAMPWGFIATAIALTIGLCILAGLAPARHAARTNIVDALHVS